MAFQSRPAWTRSATAARLAARASEPGPFGGLLGCLCGLGAGSGMTLASKKTLTSSVPRGGPLRVEFASTRWWPCAVPVTMRRRGDGHQLAGSIMSASLGSESGGGTKMPAEGPRPKFGDDIWRQPASNVRYPAPSSKRPPNLKAASGAASLRLPLSATRHWKVTPRKYRQARACKARRAYSISSGVRPP